MKNTSKVKEKSFDDYIGREEFVQQIIDTIGVARKDRAWCFAINGEWGSGKSFVVDMLQNELEKNKQYFVIKYDAWKNDFYNEPLVAILYNVIDCIENKKLSAEIKNGLKTGLELILKLLKGDILVDRIKDISKTMSKPKTSANRLDITENIQSYYDALEILKQSLSQLAKKYKVVVLVDEIDRCDPEYSLEVLNRLHNLFEVPNVITLVSVNKEMLNNLINNKYQDNNKYLEKFFDLTFDLPNEGIRDLKFKMSALFLSRYFPEMKMMEPVFFYHIIDCFVDGTPRKIVKFFEKLHFLYKDYKNTTQNYSMICLSAYLLAMQNNDNFLNSFIKEDSLYDHSKRIDLRNSEINIDSYFKEEFIRYLETMRSSYNTVGFTKYQENSINEFFGMLNILQFIDDDRICNTIVNNYCVKLPINIVGELKAIISTLKVIGNI